VFALLQTLLQRVVVLRVVSRSPSRGPSSKGEGRPSRPSSRRGWRTGRRSGGYRVDLAGRSTRGCERALRLTFCNTHQFSPSAVHCPNMVRKRTSAERRHVTTKCLGIVCLDPLPCNKQEESTRCDAKLCEQAEKRGETSSRQKEAKLSSASTERPKDKRTGQQDPANQQSERPTERQANESARTTTNERTRARHHEYTRRWIARVAVCRPQLRRLCCQGGQGPHEKSEGENAGTRLL
jgi:hypothetical protein